MKKIVLERYRDAFLIARVQEDDTVYEYVVCSDYDGESWYWGHYFETLREAMEYFIEERVKPYEEQED